MMGVVFSELHNAWRVVIEMFPPSPQFGIGQIPDLTERVVIVTGKYTLPAQTPSS